MEMVGRVPADLEVEELARTRLESWRRTQAIHTDRILAVLMLLQWLFAITLALWVSPWTWKGSARALHLHVWTALLVGGVLTAGPVCMAAYRPGSVLTRHVMAVAQMLWSALLIHLTGGRIETHFHVFGSLAFIAFYRDWRPLVTATVVVSGDHLLRGLFWPESVYGMLTPEGLRFLEHAAWVLFEDAVLLASIFRSEAELEALAWGQAQLEVLSRARQQASERLAKALDELHATQEAKIRHERLAALGTLAASVGHDLRNPLGAIRGAATFVARRLAQGQASDPRVPKFLDLVDREVLACDRIIGDLLDFARDRLPTRQPCPLAPLVAEAVELVVPGDVSVETALPEDLPVPHLDREQFRRVLVNLVQNAVDALGTDRADGRVAVEAARSSRGDSLVVRVRDNGPGLPEEVRARLFEPLVTTKLRGTGLGLAIVSRIVAAHGGTVTAATCPGSGTTFEIRLPLPEPETAAPAPLPHPAVAASIPPPEPVTPIALGGAA